MNFLFPLIASIMQASSFTIDKLVLSAKKITHKQYLGISFPAIAILTLIIFLIFQPPLDFSLFQGKYFLLILLAIALSMASNLIFYNALKHDFLSEIQSIELMRDLPLIIFAALIFPDERNYLRIILALIAGISIIWSHWEKKGFKIAKRTLPLLLWNLVANPFRGIISKYLLETWNPISFQLIINGSIGIIFFFLFFKNIKKTPKKAIPYLMLTNFLTTIAWILYFFSFKQSGIIYTVLIFSLQPLLVYLAGIILYKEKIEAKKLASFAIILAAIILAQI